MSDRGAKASNADLLRAAMDAQGITDPELRAGIAAIVGGESGWIPKTETPYNRTANDRIRQIFKTALSGKDDNFINALKRDPELFFNHVYGPHGAGRQLGNTEVGDGYKFRGRGGVQLTGRWNYTELAKLSGLDLVGNPDLVNVPENSAVITVAYMRWRYRGGGWEAIKAAVGNSFGSVDEAKNRLFARYLRSGEFAPGGGAADPAEAGGQLPAHEAAPLAQRNPAVVIAIIKALQASLVPYGYAGEIDGDIGTQSQAALAAFSRRAR